VVTNPFEDPDASYYVLINEEGQHSLWPVFADVPKGWEVIFGESGRQECLDFIEESWTDMRPKSLIEAMELDAAARSSAAATNGDVAGNNGAAANGDAKGKERRSPRASKKEKAVSQK
jgi:MbtH protein